MPDEPQPLARAACGGMLYGVAVPVYLPMLAASGAGKLQGEWAADVRALGQQGCGETVPQPVHLRRPQPNGSHAVAAELRYLRRVERLREDLVDERRPLRRINEHCPHPRVHRHYTRLRALPEDAQGAGVEVDVLTAQCRDLDAAQPRRRRRALSTPAGSASVPSRARGRLRRAASVSAAGGPSSVA